MVSQGPSKGKPSCWSALFLVLLISLTSCKRELFSTADTLVLHLGSDIPDLDPVHNTTAVSAIVLRQVYEGLLGFDEKDRLVQLAAERQEWVAGQRTWKFFIRKDAVWNDGTPVLVQHFIDGLKSLLDSSNGFGLADLFYIIQGAKAFHQGKTPWESVGVKQINDQELHIQLTHESMDFLSILASGYLYPRKGILTNGPFQLKNWKKEQWIQLTANPFYRLKPKLSALTFLVVPEPSTALTLFETGKLDVLEQIPSVMINKFQSDKRFRRSHDPSVYYVGFNTRKKPFSRRDVRCLLAQAFSSEEIIQVLAGEVEAAHGFVHPLLQPMAGKKTAPAQVSLKQLQKKWSENFPANGKKMEIELSFNTHERHQMLMERLSFVVEQRLPVRFQLRNEEWKSYLAHLQSDAPALFRFAQQAPYPSALAMLGVFAYSGGSNYTGWESERYRGYLEKVEVARTPEQKQEWMTKAENLLVHEECVIMPIYFYTRNVLVSERARSVGFNFQGLVPLVNAELAR